jgi:hypothetical protein
MPRTMSGKRDPKPGMLDGGSKIRHRQKLFGKITYRNKRLRGTPK